MGSLAAYLGQQRDDERAENERLRKEATYLREQLRLANDKMAEMKRREAHWVASEALRLIDNHGSASRYLESVRDANAPKD